MLLFATRHLLHVHNIHTVTRVGLAPGGSVAGVRGLEQHTTRVAADVLNNYAQAHAGSSMGGGRQSTWVVCTSPLGGGNKHTHHLHAVQKLVKTHFDSHWSNPTQNYPAGQALGRHAHLRGLSQTHGTVRCSLHSRPEEVLLQGTAQPSWQAAALLTQAVRPVNLRMCSRVTNFQMHSNKQASCKVSNYVKYKIEDEGLSSRLANELPGLCIYKGRNNTT